MTRPLSACTSVASDVTARIALLVLCLLKGLCMCADVFGSDFPNLNRTTGAAVCIVHDKVAAEEQVYPCNKSQQPHCTMHRCSMSDMTENAS